MFCRTSLLIAAPALLLLLLSAVTAAPQRQQQQQPAQRRTISAQAPANRPQRPTPPPGDIARLKEGAQLQKLDEGHLTRFLDNEASVKQLTNCFLDYDKCPSPRARSLINQIRALGTGGSCKNCSDAEQKNLNALIYLFIQRYMNDYPEYWKQVVLQIPHILAG